MNRKFLRRSFTLCSSDAVCEIDAVKVTGKKGEWQTRGGWDLRIRVAHLYDQRADFCDEISGARLRLLSTDRNASGQPNRDATSKK